MMHSELHRQRCTALRVKMCLVFMCIVGVDASCACNTTTVWNALAALYESTSLDGGWTRSDNWMQQGSRVCDWHGIESCKKINLTGNHLVGTLPPALSLMHELEVLLLTNNRLYGTLPREYAMLSHLKELEVNDNALTGTLPPEYANMSLIKLGVSRNSLSGALPLEYGSKADMVWFYAEANAFNGTLPHQYSNWRSLRGFAISNNSFVGTLPAAYGSWERLERFECFSAGLNGTFPSSYGAWRLLDTLWTYGNGLSGTLPDAYRAWITLREADLSDNLLTGQLPFVFREWRSVQFLRLDNNRFNGTIPPEFGEWLDMRQFQISNNSLRGAIPAELGRWTHLINIALDNNMLESAVPSILGRLEFLTGVALHNNRLTGSLPSTFSNLKRLQTLLLSGNDFVGSVPQSWTSLPLLYFLALHNNPGLSGALPQRMPALLAVSVCNTQLCGDFPVLWQGALVVCPDNADLAKIASSPPLPRALPVLLCLLPPLTSAPPLFVNTSRNLPSPVASSVSTATALAVATVTAGITGSVRLSAVLQVSFHAGFVSRCRDAREDAPFGAAVPDNPLRLQLLGGPHAYTYGAVVGNLLVMFVAPALTTMAHRLAGLLKLRRVFDLKRGVAATCIGAVTALFASTVAASIVLLEASSQHAAASSMLAVGVVGVSFASFWTIVVVAAIAQSRLNTKWRQWPTSPAPFLVLGRAPRSVLQLALVAAEAATAACGEWTVRVRSRGWAAAATEVLLETVRGPSKTPSLCCTRWVVCVDVAVVTMQSIIIGVGHSESCRAAVASGWSLLAVCTAQLLVATALRPRQTLEATANDVLMSAWTTGVVLSACLKASEDTLDALSTTQALIQLLWSMPVCGWWCTRRCFSKQGWRPAKDPPKIKAVSIEPIGTQYAAAHQESSVHDILSSLIATICQHTIQPKDFLLSKAA